MNMMMMMMMILTSNTIFNVYYNLQHLHLDVRRDIVHNFHGIVTYMSYLGSVPSLRFAFIADTYR